MNTGNPEEPIDWPKRRMTLEEVGRNTVLAKAITWILSILFGLFCGYIALLSFEFLLAMGRSLR